MPAHSSPRKQQAPYTLKKSLGQHFLHDALICQEIVTALQAPSGRVLEVGPGAGALTGILIQQPYKTFKAVEIDAEKVRYLLTQWPDLKDRLIEADFLQVECPWPDLFSVIGNFPYQISTQIIFRVLDWRQQVEEVVGMFQQEVAERISSPHGTKAYGIQSVLVQTYYEVSYLMKIAPDRFTPPPKVDSGVIRLQRRSGPDRVQDYTGFKKFVKAAFQQRRKTLRNNLKGIIRAERLQDDFFQMRAEQVSVDQFIDLFHQELSGIVQQD